MCTAISYVTKDHYFGRNLDLEYSYEESITITPRNFPLHFRHKDTIHSHYALIGVAYVHSRYPLYYEATNEAGLSMAGLDFPNYTDYKEMDSDKDNITPFEFIPWILAQCKSVQEARVLLQNINLVRENFSQELPVSPLHWIISDRTSSLVVECLKSGLKIYDNPFGVLTNAPEFDVQLAQFNKDGAVPGDWTSSSRFQRAIHVKEHSSCNNSESDSVSQFFHLLDAVAVPRGVRKSNNQRYRYTIYSSCCNTSKGIYYYKTYDNFQINAIDMHLESLDGNTLISYPMIKMAHIRLQNR